MKIPNTQATRQRQSILPRKSNSQVSFSFVLFSFSTPWSHFLLAGFEQVLRVCAPVCFWAIGIKKKGSKFYVGFSPAMWFAGGRRLLYLSAVVLLAASVLQAWLCCHTCQVGAIRVFPANAGATVKFSHGIMDKKSKEDLLHKYFSGRTFGPSNRTEKGFEESKRRVPSCPDPLHN